MTFALLHLFHRFPLFYNILTGCLPYYRRFHTTGHFDGLAECPAESILCGLSFFPSGMKEKSPHKIDSAELQPEPVELALRITVFLLLAAWIGTRNTCLTPTMYCIYRILLPFTAPNVAILYYGSLYLKPLQDSRKSINCTAKHIQKKRLSEDRATLLEILSINDM